jgi:GNAT superfamily N-acetyltransferase
MISIRVAVPADAALLAGLARRTFHDTYARSDPPPTNLQVHMDRHFGEQQQAAELADAGMTTLVVEHDGIAIGYALLATGEAPECVVGAAPIQIRRFYLEQAWTARGVAQQLMAATEVEARRRRGQTLWLVAWSRNYRALAFYRKCGFAAVGTTPYHFGNTVEIDTVMARAISP